MIATQRQQKKNARYKKKIPGSGGKGQHDSDNHDRTPKQVPKIEDTPTPQSAVIVKNEINDDQDMETENKYSKRKVVSNADRYREIDDNEYQVETDEQLQARLIQLLNIPKVHMSTTPVFDDEVDSSYEQSSSFLALDCNTLVRALESIPTHRKLLIDTALMDLGDQTHDITPTVPEIVQGTQRTDQKKYPLQPELVLKKGKSGFQFQSPAPAKVKVSGEYSHKPREEKLPSMTGAREDNTQHTASKPTLYPSTVTCGVSQPITAIPNSEAPLRHTTSLATELDNVLDGILAL
ncbi:hypothetical protein EMCRGX_G033100 [Ephydatia muelleri]